MLPRPSRNTCTTITSRSRDRSIRRQSCLSQYPISLAAWVSVKPAAATARSAAPASVREGRRKRASRTPASAPPTAREPAIRLRPPSVRRQTRRRPFAMVLSAHASPRPRAAFFAVMSADSVIALVAARTPTVRHSDSPPGRRAPWSQESTALGCVRADWLAWRHVLPRLLRHSHCSRSASPR